MKRFYFFTLALGLLIGAVALALWASARLTVVAAPDQTTWYVHPAGSDSDTGTLGLPFATIQHAIDVAGDGDTILVAAGTYTETLDVYGNALILRGGYTISDTVWLPHSGETIVDAGGADSAVFTITPNNSLTVESLTVQGANHISGWGGGFNINGATVIISDTVIRDNVTSESGAGTFVENTLNVENVQFSLINSTFISNVATDATAGLVVGGENPIQLALENTAFIGNIGLEVLSLEQTFSVVGGQVSNNTVSGSSAIGLAGSGTISGTEIVSNTSGAMGIGSDSAVSAHNLTIRGNTGGGIVSQGFLTLTNSLIANNSGGDWFLVTSVNEAAPGTERLTLDGCTIRGNSNIPGVMGLGGYAQVWDTVIEGNDSLANNGDIINIWADAVQVDLVNLLLADNQSARPVVNGNTATGTILLMNVTAAGNSVSNFPVLAGEGIWTVINTIVWGNTTPGDMLGLSTFSVNYSNIEGGWLGEGNIGADPLFRDAANGDYRLKAGSPCIDAGTANGAPDHDLEGDARPHNAGYDIGADEFVGTPVPNRGTRYVAMTGSDAGPNLCLDPAAPCQTVGHGLTMAQSGDAIRVAQGTYLENLAISKAVTLSGGYVVSGTAWLPGGETVLDGSGNPTVVGDWDGKRLVKPAVIRDGAEYKMWFDGRNLLDEARVGLATSSDGVSWTRLGDPVLSYATGAWDRNARAEHAPFVLKEDGVYKMWYEGANRDGIRHLGYATSTNGIDWTPYPGNPVLEAGPESYDQGGAAHGSVLNDGSTYKLWYHAISKEGVIIAYATSADGINWTKQRPVLESQPGQWDTNLWGPSVLKRDGIYWMWYAGSGPAQQPAIGVVTSTNGITWTRFLAGPVVTETQPIGDPHVISDSGGLRMWYQDFEQGGIHYAESDDGIAWTKSVSNPVLTPRDLGQWGDPIVRFEAGSDGAGLNGFTITGGDTNEGGGILVAGVGPVTIANSVITGNYADHGGGGIMIDGYAQAQIINTVVAHNSADHGGGIAVRSGSSAFINDTRLISNTAHESGGGIGIWAEGPTVVMANTVISDNYGYHSGGVSMWEPGGTFTGTNLLIVDNHSGPGPAGLALESSGGRLTNVTVACNDSDAGVDGAAIEGPASGFPIVNSIFWGNGADDANLQGSNLNVSHSDVGGGWPGVDNIDADPRFVDATNGDYHLRAGSPCIDAGTSAGAPETDIEGTPRDASPDMGAYEWVATTVSAPINPQTGGTLTSPAPQGGGTTLQVPPGAVSASTTISLTTLGQLSVPSGLAFAGHAFALTPDLSFEAGTVATLTIDYTDEDVQGIEENSLRLYRQMGGEWREIGDGSVPGESQTLDTANNVLTARLRRLSKFTTFGAGIANRIFMPLVLKDN